MLRDTLVAWIEDGIPARGAALSYYVLLSLGPLLVLLVGGLTAVLDGPHARAAIVRTIREQAGTRAAQTAATVLERVEFPDPLAPESFLTLALLLFGATAVFANIRGSLDRIWGVGLTDGSRREQVLDYLRGRWRSFLMVGATGAVLVASFAISSAVGVLSRVLGDASPFGWVAVRALDATLSVLLIGLLFGAIYRTLPSARIEWSTVWVGAFATALLFVIGKSVVTWLIASASWTTYYGPGASVVAFLAWVYFSSQVFYLGAEFTQVWSVRRGGVLGTAASAERS